MCMYIQNINKILCTYCTMFKKSSENINYSDWILSIRVCLDVSLSCEDTEDGKLNLGRLRFSFSSHHSKCEDNYP